MFVVHSSLNGLVPETQPSESVSDEMDRLMSDWSWSPAQVERCRRDSPGYVYTTEERTQWLRQAERNARATRNEECARARLDGVCCPGAYDSPDECLACDDNKGGYNTTMPAVQPWSIPAYRGTPARPQRIGG